MKLKKLHDIKFTTKEAIHQAVLSKPNEIIILFHSGEVIRHNLDTNQREHLFSITKTNYSGGDFDPGSEISIHTLDDIIVVTSSYKENGYVHYPEKYKKLSLQREDYHASISKYPIALFKNKNLVPHLVYGIAWNHVQIMNLDTRQILTASKSLIEENAEEDHIEFYKTHEETNKHPWPSPYDYFYGELKMSPDHKHFLCAGWVWGSYDAYNIYKVDNFINSNRIKEISIGGWQHDNRAVCWIDSITVAVAYSPLMEGDNGATKETPNELHIYKLSNNETVLEREIKVGTIDIVHSTIHYSTQLDAFFLYSKNIGVVIISFAGELLYENKEIEIDQYFPDGNQFLTVTETSITVSQVIK